MIERIVLFKLKGEYCNDRARAEIAERTRKDLGALKNVRSISVGRDAEKSWDLSLVVRFDTLEDVDAYIADPEHRAYVDDYMHERIELIKAWNFRG
ncbi:MAG: Dabb family protein [Deltaproteobacteria bacterium]|nr:Dabb family protein [Deltaproteobacteria bacterium]